MEIVFFIGWTIVVAGGTWIIAYNTAVDKVIFSLLCDLVSDGLVKLEKNRDGEMELKKAD